LPAQLLSVTICGWALSLLTSGNIWISMLPFGERSSKSIPWRILALWSANAFGIVQDECEKNVVWGMRDWLGNPPRDHFVLPPGTSPPTVNPKHHQRPSPLNTASTPTILPIVHLEPEIHH